MLATASLGELLVADRVAVGVELHELSSETGFDLTRIEAVEAGRHDLTDDELCQLLDRYTALSSARLASSRRPLRALIEIDLDAGSLRLRRTRRPRSLPAADRNLLHYLSMVHRHNGLRVGTDIPLKAVDLNLLRASLALRRGDVASRLDRMTGRIGADLTPSRSLLAAAVATGLVVAAGAIILMPSGRSGNEPTTSPGAIDPRIDIGTPLVIERSPDAANVTPPGPEADPRGDVDAELELGADAGTGVAPIGSGRPSVAADPGAGRTTDQPVPRLADLDRAGPRGPPTTEPMISS